MTTGPAQPTVRITVPSLDPDFDAVWTTLLDLAAIRGAVWTLIGGQMVLLHALEHDRMPPVVSTDGDALADLRANQKSLRLLSDRLIVNGYTAVHTPGVSGPRTHRFERVGEIGPVVIDVLAPEGLGPKADLTTVHPGRTIEVPGGSQALHRTELVEIEHNGRVATIGRPNLLGAIIAKASACRLPHGDTERHYRDLAFLLTLVDDVEPLAAGLLDFGHRCAGEQLTRSLMTQAAKRLAAVPFVASPASSGFDATRIPVRPRDGYRIRVAFGSR